MSCESTRPPSPRFCIDACARSASRVREGSRIYRRRDKESRTSLEASRRLLVASGSSERSRCSRATASCVSSLCICDQGYFAARIVRRLRTSVHKDPFNCFAIQLRLISRSESIPLSSSASLGQACIAAPAASAVCPCDQALRLTPQRRSWILPSHARCSSHRRSDARAVGGRKSSAGSRPDQPAVGAWSDS